MVTGRDLVWLGVGAVAGGALVYLSLKKVAPAAVESILPADVEPSSILRRVVLTSVDPASAVEKLDTATQQGALSGSLANHSSETKFAKWCTNNSVLTFPNGSETNGSRCAPLELPDAKVIEFNYHPRIVIAEPAGGYEGPMLRHVFLARFKVGAPLAELVNGYAGLTKTIKAPP